VQYPLNLEAQFWETLDGFAPVLILLTFLVNIGVIAAQTIANVTNSNINSINENPVRFFI
jgi:hypothetical protein